MTEPWQRVSTAPPNSPPIHKTRPFSDSGGVGGGCCKMREMCGSGHLFRWWMLSLLGEPAAWILIEVAKRENHGSAGTLSTQQRWQNQSWDMSAANGEFYSPHCASAASGSPVLLFINVFTLFLRQQHAPLSLLSLPCHRLQQTVIVLFFTLSFYSFIRSLPLSLCTRLACSLSPLSERRWMSMSGCSPLLSAALTECQIKKNICIYTIKLRRDKRSAPCTQFYTFEWLVICVILTLAVYYLYRLLTSVELLSEVYISSQNQID